MGIKVKCWWNVHNISLLKLHFLFFLFYLLPFRNYGMNFRFSGFLEITETSLTKHLVQGIGSAYPCVQKWANAPNSARGHWQCNGNIIEPRQANLCLRAFRHDKFQLRMPSHSEGPRIWLSVWRFLVIHCFYERAAKVLARLRVCAGSPEPSLLA